MPYHLPLSNDFNVLYACIPVPVDIYHRAAFVGQIEALTRWYSWDRDLVHSGKDAAAVWQNCRDLMTISDRCDVLACANGITLEIDPDNPNTSSGTTIHDIQTFNCSFGDVDVYMIRSFFVPPLPAYVGLRLRRDGLTVGGDIPHLRVMTFQDNPVPNIQIQRVDCFDVVHTHGPFGAADSATLSYVEMKRMAISAFESFMVTITIPHELNCTPA